jgi:hypothetical protein
VSQFSTKYPAIHLSEVKAFTMEGDWSNILFHVWINKECSRWQVHFWFGILSFFWGVWGLSWHLIVIVSHNPLAIGEKTLGSFLFFYKLYGTTIWFASKIAFLALTNGLELTMTLGGHVQRCWVVLDTFHLMFPSIDSSFIGWEYHTAPYWKDGEFAIKSFDNSESKYD